MFDAVFEKEVGKQSLKQRLDVTTVFCDITQLFIKEFSYQLIKLMYMYFYD